MPSPPPTPTRRHRPTWPAVAIGGPVAAAAAWMAWHRRSPAVQGWTRPERPSVPAHPLHVEVANPDADGPVVVLLHGITASGRSFGADFDALPVTVVVPDLLGFGRSMDVATGGYTVEDHVIAVEATLRDLGLADRPTLLVGHSMGAVLALHLAGHLAEPLAVLALCAPLYDDADEGLARIGEADPLAGMVAVGDLAERICTWMCDHRRLASVLWPLLAPRWPVPVAADGVLHTWPAYRGSLASLVLDSGYRTALTRALERDVGVRLIEGGRDGVPVAGRARALAEAHAGVSAAEIHRADHALPLSHPTACTREIARLLERS